jgi:ribosomal protein S18 acetylase RimI-like enzyme
MKHIIISSSKEDEKIETAQVLSIAMIDNPIHIAVYKAHGENERKLLENTYMKLLNNPKISTFTAKLNEQIIGVMCCVTNCKNRKIKDVTDTDNIANRKKIWLTEWLRYEPLEQHCHLGPIAILPSFQRNGVGTKLMHYFCEILDKNSYMGYLETDREKNILFYKKFGFEVIQTSEVLSVKTAYMLRPCNV